MEQFATAVCSDPGKQLDRNEDAALATIGVTPAMQGVLIAVADGMGGEPAGDRASSIAIEAVGAAPLGDDPGSDLTTAVATAHDAVRAFSCSSPNRAGSGTTLVAAYLRGDRAWIVNVGDSRAYLLRAYVLEQITLDHSLVQEAVDSGDLDPDDTEGHPQSHLITQCLGTPETPIADLFERALLPGDLLILCSDGLTDAIPDIAIATIAWEHAATPDAVAAALVDAANNAGGPDNITAVVVRAG